MRKTLCLRYWLMVSLWLVCVSGWAAPPQISEEQAHAADHEQLRALLRTATEAVNAGDLETLSSLLAPEFMVTMVDQTVVTDLQGLNDYFQRLVLGEEPILQSIVLDPEADALTEFIDERTGLSYGHSTDTYTLPGGEQLVMKSRWTATLVKTGDDWTIRAFHAGVNMLDNPILASAQRMSYVWGAGGVVLGALLVLLLRRRTGA